MTELERIEKELAELDAQREALLSRKRELAPWEPRVGETYYLAVTANRDMYVECVWNDDPKDCRWFSRGLIHRTAEEAVAVANAMIRAAKEGK